MKPFEEQFTAWVDGQLDARESAEFEARLAADPSLLGDKESTLALGDLLRAHSAAPVLSHGDFFNAEILRQIESPAKAPRRFWQLPRLVWPGLAFTAAALVLFVTIIPRGSVGKSYVAQVLKARPGDKGLSATAFYSNENQLTVLWLDGDADSAAPAANTP